MKEVLELRPDRNLIDNDFSGYKLSLETIPIFEKDLDDSVDVASTGADQYSCAHVTIFSFHNYLFSNPHPQGMCYFINKRWQIMQISIGFMNRVEKIVNVCKIPTSRDRHNGDYPADIKFLASDSAVITDGMGTFHVATVKKNKWIIVFSDNLPDDSTLLQAYKQDKNVYLLSRKIIEPKFDSILTLLALDENWQTKSEKKVQVFGNLKFTSIESPKFVTIIADGQKKPKFLDGPKQLDEPDEKAKYKWTQTAEDITIIISIKDVEEKDIETTLTEQTLKVSMKNEDIIQGNFAHAVSNAGWKFNDGELEIKAQKIEKGLGWKEVIEGDSSGHQFQTPVADADEDHVFNNEELEEVDVSSPALLLRLNMEEARITHQADLSTLQLLHTVHIDANKPPAICLRHLTDACVWQLETNADDSWQQKHVATFSAFGYVQASKIERKFIFSPANFSYVVIADAFQHLYIFRQPSPVNGILRNRTSGTQISAIAKQQLVKLETKDEIIGIHGNDNLLLVLTKSKLFTLVINETPV